MNVIFRTQEGKIVMCKEFELSLVKELNPLLTIENSEGIEEEIGMCKLVCTTNIKEHTLFTGTYEDVVDLMSSILFSLDSGMVLLDIVFWSETGTFRRE